ncbi:MAG: 3-phosphoshikimate 1-carboxyvinyltransferase, partial [Nanoarchaeota archaeon]
SERIKQRPIKGLLKSLNDLGIKCSSKNNGFPPVEVNGGTLDGGTTKIKGNVSSQFISSLLIISPYAKNDVEIIVENELVSKNYVDMTIDLMKEFGINVKRDNYKRFKVKAGQKYNAKNYVVPADWSSANYFLAAAAIVPGRIKINEIDLGQKGEAEFIDILKKMGCKVNRGKNSIEVIGNKKLNAVEVDMSTMPDSVQTLATVAAFAKGTTRIKNIGNLKYKESDRINDTASELKKIGIKATAKDDELVIEGGNPKPAAIDPHNDHRMAMSFALIGLKVGIKIKNPECVAKSFPDFWEKLEEIGAEVRND